MVSGQQSAQTIKKQLQIRYPLAWKQQVNTMMGMFSSYYINNQIYRSYWTFNKILEYIHHDKRQRLFLKSKDLTDIDESLKTEFEGQAFDFRMLFGTEPNPKNWCLMCDERYEAHRGYCPRCKITLKEKPRLFSLLDLRTAATKIEPKDDRVFIARDVPIVDSWGKSPAEYVALKIGYVYPVTTYNMAGFPMQQLIPMFSWNDPNIYQKKSNCVPYSYYHEQRMKVLVELNPIVTELETIIARYLHRENLDYKNMPLPPGTTEDDEYEDTGSDDFVLDESDGDNV